jgi:hypothetical protein
MDSLLLAAKAFVIAGMAYVPICLMEIFTGPQLYALLYGYQPHRWIGAQRYFGFRLIGLLEDGNQLGIWMPTSALIAIWLLLPFLLPSRHDLAKTLTALVLLGVVTLIVLRLSNVISLRAVVKHYVAANAAFSFSEGLGVAPSDGGCHKMRSMSALRSPDQFSALASGIGGRRAPCVLGPCGCLPSGCMAWLDCLL